MPQKNIDDSLKVDFDCVKTTLKSLLSDYRYEHTLRVAKESALLASHYSINSDYAFLAGLIHDAAKELDISQLDLNFTDFHLSLYQSFPAIAHAFVLDVVVPAYFLDVPTIITEAAVWHTTGKADMSDLEKIVFIADFIEPNRTIENRQFIYDLAYQSLDKAVFEIAFFKLNFLLKSRKSIYSKLVDCYNFYNNKV